MNRRNFLQTGVAGLLLPASVRAQSVMIPGPGISRGPTAFIDTFIDTNGTDLASHTATPNGGVWTRVDGSANDLQIQSNKLAATLAAESAYRCASQGSANHYTQAVWYGGAAVGIATPFICVRLTNSVNFLGLRHSGADWQLYKRDTGTFSLLGSFTADTADGDVMYIGVDSSNLITCKINGTTQITATDSFNASEVRQGLVSRANTFNPWIDDFEAGAL